MTAGNPPLTGLTESQRVGLDEILLDIRQANSWSWELPVLLRDRCWLRLDRVQLSQLKRVLPPDGRDEAPELMHYRLLVNEGIDPLMAEQTCWQEFGMEDCHRALHDYWQSRMESDHGWTARRYRQLVSLYRDRIEAGMTTVPMLILARKESSEDHQIHWITDMSSIRELPNTKHCHS